MRQSDCLSEQDLTLLHYGEAPDTLSLEAARQHLSSCPDCSELSRCLSRDLNSLPTFEPELATHNATRLAARVVDSLPRRRSLLPAIAGAFSTAAIIFAVTIWTPEPQVVHNVAIQPPVAIEQPAVPEVDLLENLELLKEFDTLSEIVGV